MSENIPEEVEESDEEVIPLIDPRKSRTQKLQSENSKSISSVAEPVVSVQDTADSVQISSVQYMTEQATGLKISVLAQQQIQTSNQSISGLPSTEHQSISPQKNQHMKVQFTQHIQVQYCRKIFLYSGPQ